MAGQKSVEAYHDAAGSLADSELQNLLQEMADARIAALSRLQTVTETGHCSPKLTLVLLSFLYKLGVVFRPRQPSEALERVRWTERDLQQVVKTALRHSLPMDTEAEIKSFLDQVMTAHGVMDRMIAQRRH